MLFFIFVGTLAAQAKKPESIIMEVPEEDVNHRAVESRSAHKVNDYNKEITSQTQMAAPVTACLFYFISVLLIPSKNALEEVHSLIFFPGMISLRYTTLIIHVRRDMSKS